jgi:hypothetical protein
MLKEFCGLGGGYYFLTGSLDPAEPIPENKSLYG